MNSTDSGVSASSAAAFTLPQVVCVPPYDPSCHSGPARIVRVKNEDTVVLKFIIGGGRPQAVSIARLAPKDRDAVQSWWHHRVSEWRPFESGTPTWHRLIRYGSVCERGQGMTATGMKTLWGLFMSDLACQWLETKGGLPLETLLQQFTEVWWHYCCACAHADSTRLTPRQKLLVLELMCASLEKKENKHASVFVALLMQVVLIRCHDQSLCHIGADLSNVGYNHRVDCGKVGCVVKASALCRHETTTPCAAASIGRVRKRRKPIVWLLQKRSLKFKRCRRYKLFDEFDDGKGGLSRMERGTNRIKYWNEDEEDYVYADDFHTTLDAVEFKRCGDQVRSGDVWLEDGVHEWKVSAVNPVEATPSAHPKSNRRCRLHLHAVDDKTKERVVVFPYQQTIPTGTRRQCDEAISFLSQSPDVVNTMALSTGHPFKQMRTTRAKVKVCNVKCCTRPMTPSGCCWAQYVLWRCAVSITLGSMEGFCHRVAAPYAKKARTSWLHKDSGVPHGVPHCV